MALNPSPILILAYVFPPDNYSGADRPGRFAKYLERLGHEVTVLAAGPERGMIQESAHVYRVRGELEHIPRVNRLEQAMRIALFPYDEGTTWLPGAVRAARTWMRQSPPPVLFSTSPPVATHLAALWLKRRYRTRWIADFRDPLAGNPFRKLRRVRAIDRIVERQIFRHADAVIANTEPVAEAWRKRYPEAKSKIHVLWNGFDPETSPAALPLPARAAKTLTHIGTVYGTRQPTILLKSIERLARRGEVSAQSLRICLLGPANLDSAAGETIERLRTTEMVDFESRQISKQDSQRMTAESDYLLLLDVLGEGAGLQVPAKLFEYLTIGRPILALTSRGSSVERILARAGIPYACLYPDAPEEEIDSTLRKFLDLLFRAGCAIRVVSRDLRCGAPSRSVILPDRAKRVPPMSTADLLQRSPEERARIEDLLRILPKGQETVLEIGARDGRVTQLLPAYCGHVTALDLEKPAFAYERVTPVKGDVRRLEFADRSFDCVFCTEVLEHVPGVEQAASEIARVAKRNVVIGVPFRQDTRIGRTTCRHCGKPNPPWGHVNTFDEQRLRDLFPNWTVATKSFVGANHERTNALAAWLQDLGGNPYGSYDQDEPCIYCGRKQIAPERSGLLARALAAAGVRLQNLQSRIAKPWPNWIHVVLIAQRTLKFVNIYVTIYTIYSCSFNYTLMRIFNPLLVLLPVATGIMGAAVLNVPAGGNLQQALNTAQAGDTITLAPGATYVGYFTLPANYGSSYITITTADPSSLPSAQQRITPAAAANLPKIVAPGSASAITTAPGAQHYILRGVEVTVTPSVYAVDLINIGSSDSSDLSTYPNDIVIDRCYIHGDPNAGGKRGIAMNGKNLVVENSYLSDFKSTIQDSQAIAGWNGPGPIQILNNYLEGGQSVLFGGAAPSIQGLVPSNIQILYNHMTRPMSWKNVWPVMNLA